MLYFTGIGFRGTLFRSDLDGNVVDIHDFFGGDGERPPAGVIEAEDGNLYGTTRFSGGPESLGTVFRFDRPSTYEAVHAFSGQGRTLGGVVEGSDGRLYGTTSGQLVGPGNNGGVFGVDLSGPPGGHLLPVLAGDTGPDGGVSGEGARLSLSRTSETILVPWSSSPKMLS